MAASYKQHKLLWCNSMWIGENTIMEKKKKKTHLQHQGQTNRRRQQPQTSLLLSSVAFLLGFSTRNTDVPPKILAV
jgi:hypothetical protein